MFRLRTERSLEVKNKKQSRRGGSLLPRVMDLLKFAKKLWCVRKALVLLITPGLLLPLLFLVPEKVGRSILKLNHHSRPPMLLQLRHLASFLEQVHAGHHESVLAGVALKLTVGAE